MSFICVANGVVVSVLVVIVGTGRLQKDRGVREMREAGMGTNNFLDKVHPDESH